MMFHKDQFLGPLPFPLYANDLSETMGGKSKPFLFAGDNSIIYTNSNLEDFKNHIKIDFESINKWFEANRHSLNFDRAHCMHFTTKNSPEIYLDISYANILKLMIQNIFEYV